MGRCGLETFTGVGAVFTGVFYSLEKYPIKEGKIKFLANIVYRYYKIYSWCYAFFIFDLERCSSLNLNNNLEVGFTYIYLSGLITFFLGVLLLYKKEEKKYY